jgi:hypothetical protein
MSRAMAAILFRCPNTGLAVQAWFADSPHAEDSFEAVTCTACTGIHYINPATGKTLSAEEGRG